MLVSAVHHYPCYRHSKVAGKVSVRFLKSKASAKLTAQTVSTTEF